MVFGKEGDNLSILLRELMRLPELQHIRQELEDGCCGVGRIFRGQPGNVWVGARPSPEF